MIKASKDFSRFVSKFTVGDVCWNWSASKTANGYGQFRLEKTQLAHRVAYQTLVGDIPQGMQLDHLCRNRACVNPAHLEPVTNKVNHERGYWAQKTQCAQGHEYTVENTYTCKRGKRTCLICKRAAKKRFEDRKRKSDQPSAA